VKIFSKNGVGPGHQRSSVRHCFFLSFYCFILQDALATFLKRLAHYGNIIQKFGHFIDTSTNVLPNGSSSDAVVSRTYQAFAMALFEFLQSLNSRLVEIEKTVCAQGYFLNIICLCTVF